MENALGEDESFRPFRSVEESKRSRIKNDSPEDEPHSNGSQNGKKIGAENGNVKTHQKLKPTLNPNKIDDDMDVNCNITG